LLAWEAAATAAKELGRYFEPELGISSVKESSRRGENKLARRRHYGDERLAKGWA